MGIIESVSNLKVWTRGSQRAPHKPLLLLYAIGQYLRGEPRLLSYKNVEAPLKQLLVDFGPPRKSHHPELPFWHLYSDGFWDLTNVELPKTRVGSSSVKKKLLRELDVHGGLCVDLFDSLKDASIAARTVAMLLEQNFPDSIHEDILQAVGIDATVLGSKRKRDPRFREKILRAYGYSCAICRFSSRLGYQLVGVEAAHIKWHQAGGPDTYTNGLALCSLHHKLLDRGMITFSNDNRIIISETANGTALFKSLVIGYHGRELAAPARNTYRPAPRYIAWHVKEVFRPPGRYLQEALSPYS